MRRTDTYLSSIEHAQRVISMDWTMQNRSIVTLSIDNSLRIFSTNGNLLAESIPNEQLPFTLNKVNIEEQNKIDNQLLIFRLKRRSMIVYLSVYLVIHYLPHLV